MKEKNTAQKSVATKKANAPIPLEAFGIDPKLDGFVWGVPQIAVIINRTPRETYYLVEQGLIDCDKIGERWRSTPRRLLAPQRAEG